MVTAWELCAGPSSALLLRSTITRWSHYEVCRKLRGDWRKKMFWSSGARDLALDLKTATEKRHTSALSTVPNLHALVAQINAVVIFCLRGSGFIVYFAILRSYFWYRQTVRKMGLKMGPWKCFSFVLLLSCAWGPKMRPLVSMKLCSLWRPERQLREALQIFRTQNWVRRGKLFCRWFCFLLGQAGCISVAAWTQLKLLSYYFVSSGGLIVCC